MGLNRQYYFKFESKVQECIEHLNNMQVYKEYYESEALASQQPKPPLGVTSTDIFERQRVQELSRALFEYIESGSDKYELLVKWSDELYDRLKGLQFMKECIHE